MKKYELLLFGLAVALLCAGCGAQALPAPPPETSPVYPVQASQSSPLPPAEDDRPVLAVSPEPAPADLPPAPEESGYFDGALFVGDSIMEGIRQYVAAQRQEGEMLGTAQFLTCSAGIGLADLVGDRDWGLSFAYQGEERPLEDIVADIAPRRVFLLLGLNDLASDPDPVAADVVDRYADLILRLRSACPGVEPIIITNPPKAASQWLPDYTVNRDLDNVLIGGFVDELRAACQERDIEYVDAYEALKDENGALPDSFCRDGYVHLNHQGAAVVVQALEAFSEGR